MKLNILINGFGGAANAVLQKALSPFPLGTITSFLEEEADVPYDLPAEKVFWESSERMRTYDWNTLRPLDEELIERMRPFEAEFFRIMDRDEAFGRLLTYEMRKNRYHLLLRYWNHLIEERRINLFISDSLPHRHRIYLMYGLCRAKGIPTVLIYHVSPLEHSYIIVEHWENFAPEVGERYRALRAQYSDDEALHLPLSEKYEAYYRQQTAQGEVPPLYAYMLDTTDPLKLEKSKMLKKAKRDPLVLLKQIVVSICRRCHPQRIVRVCRHYARIHRANGMFRFYERHAGIPDLSRKYVYVPLHHQPECTTCPMAGAYTDQLLIVQMLHALLPDDVMLYVKEHPTQQKHFPDGMCRDISFYRDLLAIPRVRLVSRSFSTYALLSKAYAVATGTGTAGFEALFRGIPVFMYGHWTQQHAPGVFPIRTTEDCKRAIHAVEHGERPTLPGTRLFLKAIDECELKGCLDFRFHEVLPPETAASISIFSQALEHKIRSLFPSITLHPRSLHT